MKFTDDLEAVNISRYGVQCLFILCFFFFFLNYLVSGARSRAVYCLLHFLDSEPVPLHVRFGGGWSA